MSDNIKIKENTNKIMVRGDRNNEFIRAYQNLSKDFREELDKVLKVSLFDGYSLAISEIDLEAKRCTRTSTTSRN